MDAKKLASLLRGGPGGPLVIDSRSFVEYNSCHVLSSVNICCSKLVKRRLQQGKVTIAELIQPAARSQVPGVHLAYVSRTDHSCASMRSVTSETDRGTPRPGAKSPLIKHFPFPDSQFQIGFLGVTAVSAVGQSSLVRPSSRSLGSPFVSPYTRQTREVGFAWRVQQGRCSGMVHAEDKDSWVWPL